MKNTANDTNHALDLSKEAIEKARAALNEARSNLNSTQNATAEVELRNGRQSTLPHLVSRPFVLFTRPHRF